MLASLIFSAFYVTIVLSTHCESQSDFTCVIRCDSAASCSEVDLFTDDYHQFEDIVLNCIGIYSCINLNIYQQRNNITVSILCHHIHSCQSLSIYTVNNSTSNNDNKQLIINTFDTCSDTSAITVNCVAEDEFCKILCSSKSIYVYQASFTFVTESNQCVDRLYTETCDKLGSDQVFPCSFQRNDMYRITTWDINMISTIDNASYILHPMPTQYLCKRGEDCIINCATFPCKNVIINATMAYYLVVLCTNADYCRDMTIYTGINVIRYCLKGVFS